jgi:hypothetical protein
VGYGELIKVSLLRYRSHPKSEIEALLVIQAMWQLEIDALEIILLSTAIS